MSRRLPIPEHVSEETAHQGRQGSDSFFLTHMLHMRIQGQHMVSRFYHESGIKMASALALYFPHIQFSVLSQHRFKYSLKYNQSL